jgi:hypothetical protein
MGYFVRLSVAVEKSAVAEILGGPRFCSDCQAMLKGRLVPHEYLMQAGKPDEEVYRCLLCDTHLQRTTGQIPWEILPAAQDPDASSERVRR